jgi:MoxR-like ATPase
MDAAAGDAETPPYQYARKFDPAAPEPPPSPTDGGDRPQQTPYAYDEEIILAVNVALAANRPLLVSGPPGTGKSALAADVADQIGPGDRGSALFLHKVITGRTEGRDLLWRFDTVRRLRDAHLAAAGAAPAALAKATAPTDVEDKHEYREKGVLWKAFEASAGSPPRRAVVLIDEIDKADPDVPNSLLEVLGNGEFRCDETGEEVHVGTDVDYAPLIIITTNDERELSRPFRRRCVTLTLKAPGAERLFEIATAHGLAHGVNEPLARQLAQEVQRLGAKPAERVSPNAAEYLDALRALVTLKISLDSDEWTAVKEATLRKSLGPDLARQ